MKKHQGFSLIELMVVVFLSSLLVSGLLKLCLTINHLYRLQNALEVIKNNQTWVSHLFQKNIAMVGDLQCSYESGSFISGVHSNSASEDIDKSVLPNTDIIFISNCEKINGKVEYIKTAYFIGYSGRFNKKGEKISSLYWKKSDHPKEELVPGVEKMMIRYGISQENESHIDAYLSSEKIKNWNLVKSVFIQLLFSSVDSVYKTKNQYWFNGEKISHDHIMRKPLLIYVGVRNR